MFAELGTTFGDKLVILAFPSSEFGGQECSTDAEIAAFAGSKGFPGVLLQKGSVKGTTASPAWKCMRDAVGASDPRWNFSGKFLVDKVGAVSVPGKDIEGA